MIDVFTSQQIYIACTTGQTGISSKEFVSKHDYEVLKQANSNNEQRVKEFREEIEVYKKLTNKECERIMKLQDLNDEAVGIIKRLEEHNIILENKLESLGG